MQYVTRFAKTDQLIHTCFSFEKNSSEVFVVTQLIDCSTYFHQIFNIASAGHELHELMTISTYMASLPTNLDRFWTNPEIPGEKRAKSGRVGYWVAVHVFQENAGSLPRVVGSLCRNGCGLAYPRYRRSFRRIALCLPR